MQLNYISPGPVANAFLNDRSEVSAILGPMGSAKTTTTLMKFCAMAAEQVPSPMDGVRYTKVGVVRETQTNLKRTTIKSIKAWFGDKQCKWYGGGGSMEPLSCVIRFKVPARKIGEVDTIAELVFEFIGLDGNNIEDLAKGWEITHYWLNEGDLLSPDIKDFLDGRIGRYPSKLHGGASFYCGLIDFNAPDTENYLYLLFEEMLPEGHKLFKQPSGLSADAENLMNLPPGYYERMARGKEEWWIRRNIKAIYGFSRHGKPVYEDYNDQLHCAQNILDPQEGLPIKLSADQGVRPAIIFRQKLPNGQNIILDEVFCETGAAGLAEEVNNLRNTRYKGFRVIGGKADPASENPDDKGSDETWLDTVNRLLKLDGDERITAAETNNIDKCTTAVRTKLKKLIDGGQPALLISPRCKMLRKAMNAEYCYKKKRMASGEFEDKPIKKFPTSDLANALEFDCMDEGGYEDAIGVSRTAMRPQTTFAQTEFNVYGGRG